MTKKETFRFPTAAEVEAFRLRHDLSMEQFAELLGAAKRTVYALRNADDTLPRTRTYDVLLLCIWLLDRHPESVEELIRLKGIRPRWSGRRTVEWVRAKRQQELPAAWNDVPAEDRKSVLAVIEDQLRRILDTERDIKLAVALEAAKKALAGPSDSDVAVEEAVRRVNEIWSTEFSAENAAVTRDPVASFITEWGIPSESVTESEDGSPDAYYWNPAEFSRLATGLFVVDTDDFRVCFRG